MDGAGAELTYEARLRREMDHWQVGLACRLVFEHGHDFQSAWLLARYSRDMLEADLRKPLPLCIVTGI